MLSLIVVCLAACSPDEAGDGDKPKKKPAEVSTARLEGMRVEILFKSPIPSATKSPYADCIYSVKARTLRKRKGMPAGQPVIIFLPAFKNRQYAPEAFLRVGDGAVMDLELFHGRKDLQHLQRSDATDDFDLPVYWCDKLVSEPPLQDHGQLLLGKFETPAVTGPPVLPVDAMRDMIVAMQERFSPKGIRFAVCIPPFKEELSARYPVQEGYSPALADARKGLLSELEAREVVVIRLEESLGAPGLAESAYYPDGDNHLTASGLEAAARGIAKALVDLGWAQPGAEVFQEVVVPMGSSSFTARQVKDAQGRPVSPDCPGTTVRLIGDSLLRYPEYGRLASIPHANLAAQLSRELHQRVGNFAVSSGAAIMPSLLRQYPEVWQGAGVCVFVISPYYAFVDTANLWKSTDF